MENSNDKGQKSWGVFLLSGSYFYSRKGHESKDFHEWVSRHVSSYARHSGAVMWV